MKKIGFAVVCGILFTGCATYDYGGPRTTSIEDVDRAVGAHQPVGYRVGYKDGCDSGYVSAGYSSYVFQKDRGRYGADDLYKHGWDDGFSSCKATRSYSSRYDYYPGYYWGPRYYWGHRHHHRRWRYGC